MVPVITPGSRDYTQPLWLQSPPPGGEFFHDLIHYLPPLAFRLLQRTGIVSKGHLAKAMVPVLLVALNPEPWPIADADM